MSRRGIFPSPFFVSVTLITAVTVAVIICAFSCSGRTLDFEAEYYFVCYSVEDNSLSASSVSGAVNSYGGAGYVFEYQNNYYVTVACYYDEKAADKVRFQLLRRGLDCEVLKVERKEYYLRKGDKSREKLYLGNLTTLNSLSCLSYEAANGLDRGELSQSGAKSVLADIKSGLKGLKNANLDNCFSGELRRLIAECDAIEGFIFSKDMRRLQIAIIDTVININLY